MSTKTTSVLLTTGFPSSSAAIVDVLAAVEAAGLDVGFARTLVQAAVSMDEAKIRIAAAVTARQAADARAREIRALCATAKCPELAEGYLRSGMAVAEVKRQLTVITAKMDSVEIDSSLLPDAQGGAR